MNTPEVALGALGVTEVAVPPPGLNLNPALNLLSSQDRDALQRIAAGSAGERAKIDYLALLKSPGFNTLPPSVQAKALQTLLALEPAQADAAAEIGGLFTGKPALANRQKVREAAQRYWLCDVGKIENDLCFRAEYPLQKGLELTWKWYRKNKWL